MDTAIISYLPVVHVFTLKKIYKYPHVYLEREKMHEIRFIYKWIYLYIFVFVLAYFKEMSFVFIFVWTFKITEKRVLKYGDFTYVRISGVEFIF